MVRRSLYSRLLGESMLNLYILALRAISYPFHAVPTTYNEGTTVSEAAGSPMK